MPPQITKQPVLTTTFVRTVWLTPRCITLQRAFHPGCVRGLADPTAAKQYKSWACPFCVKMVRSRLVPRCASVRSGMRRQVHDSCVSIIGLIHLRHIFLDRGQAIEQHGVRVKVNKLGRCIPATEAGSPASAKNGDDAVVATAGVRSRAHPQARASGHCSVCCAARWCCEFQTPRCARHAGAKAESSEEPARCSRAEKAAPARRGQDNTAGRTAPSSSA